MKKFTRTFKRFITRNAKGMAVEPLWRVYKAGGKAAVLSYLNKDKTPVIASNELKLPSSMPKSACDKIMGYDDSRSKGGMIHIVLKSGFQFASGLSIASALNVKDAIAIMRTASVKVAA